ncbi:MAG TPA: hypothetical protein VE343_00285 [Streptosporangiaceae bacterium]|nr:hypothetical protein [Streptosporangiaceae bacterium]
MARADRKSSAETPAGHHTCARSPNGWRVVRRTNGSLPSSDWIRASANPVRSRCGVMIRQACARNAR